MLGGARTFLAVPLGGNRVYCYLDLSSEDSEDPTRGDPGRLEDAFGDFADPVIDLIRAATQRALSISEPSKKWPRTIG